jgi:hypothetical protein
MAKGQLFTPYQVVLAALLWAVLIVVLVRGAHRAISGGDELDSRELGLPGIISASMTGPLP